jgi:pimeloyl-ACP methyl ester carboxylesterase
MNFRYWQSKGANGVSHPSAQPLEVRGDKVNCLRKGSGSPLLFLHGARGGGVWMPFMEQLSANFDVIAPEHPGFGASGDPAWLDNMSDLAYFYLDFLDTLDLQAVHLVGNSLGGWLALEIAVRSQQRIASLGLLAPGGIFVRGRPPADIFLWTPETLTRNLFVNPDIVNAALAQKPTPEQQLVQLKNQHTVAKLGWNPRFHNPDLHKWLHRVTVPTLLVWGREDRINPVEYATAFSGLMPHARVSIIPDCGHLPHIEKMPVFVREMTEFALGTTR